MRIAFSAQSDYLATANSNSNDVTLFLIAGGQLQQGTSYVLPSGSSRPTALSFSPDNLYLAVANANSSDVTLFNIAAGFLETPTSYQLPTGSLYPSDIAFTSNGSYLATANTNSNGITLFKIASGILGSGISQSLPSGSSNPIAIAFVPDDSGTLLLATANKGSSDVSVFSMQGGALGAPESYPVVPDVVSMAASPNGTYLALAHSALNSISLLNVTGNSVNQNAFYHLPGNSSSCQAIGFSSDGNSIATANSVSNDVSVVPLFGGTTNSGPSVPGTGDGSSNNLAIILGTTLGTGAAFITVVATLAGFSLFTYWRYHQKIKKLRPAETAQELTMPA